MISPAMMVAMGPVVPSGMAGAAAIPTVPLGAAIGGRVFELAAFAAVVGVLSIAARLVQRRPSRRAVRLPAVPVAAAA